MSLPRFGRSGARRAFGPLLACAAALAASCVAGAPGHGAAEPPVFPLEGELRAASAGGPALFALSKGVKPRAVARLEPTTASAAFVAWDSGSDAVVVYGADGRARASWPLEAAAAWVSKDRLLARSDLFEPGAGFAYALYALDARSGPAELWRGRLDCFPSSVAFSPSGEAFLAGGDQADATLSVYGLSAGREPRLMFSGPKRSDFLRLVLVGDRLVAFESLQKAASRPLAVHVMGLSDGTAAPVVEAVLGAPSGALCFYGHGFEYGGDLVVPAAMDDGDLALLRLKAGEGGYVVASVARGSGGCYLPLGPDPDGGFRYLAYDFLGAPEDYYLGLYDGSRATLERLEP